MKKIKSQKGITLVALIITIILMLILTGVTVYSGIDSYKNAQVSKFVAQMQLIQEKVDNIEREDGIVLGEPINHAETRENIGSYIAEYTNDYTNDYSGGVSILNSWQDWRYFTKDDLKKDLDLEDIDGDIAIDFYKRTVISLNGVYYDGKTHHTQYNLPGGQAITQYTKTSDALDFDVDITIDGLNAIATVSNPTRKGISITNGTFKYKAISSSRTNDYSKYSDYDDDTLSDWKEITGNTVTISQTGYYVFEIVINNTGERLIKKNSGECAGVKIMHITLINAPNIKDGMIRQKHYSWNENISDNKDWKYSYDIYNGSCNVLNGAFVLNNDNEKKYVWIPRYAYRINEIGSYEIKYLKGTSNIGTDNKVITLGTGDNDWKIPTQFKEYTGLWLEYISGSSLTSIPDILINNQEYTVTQDQDMIIVDWIQQ